MLSLGEKRPNSDGVQKVSKRLRQATVHSYFQSSAGDDSAWATETTSVKLPVKTYTKEEIIQSEGLDKEFKKFWNEKVEEIMVSPSVKLNLSSKKAISGAIYTSWTLQKTKLLKILADELKLLGKEAYPNKADCEKNLFSVKRNLERIDDISCTLTVLLSEAENNPSEAVSDQITIKLSALRTAQEALKKAMSRKSKKINCILKAKSTAETYCEVDSEYEVEGIVQSIKNEDDVLEIGEEDPTAISTLSTSLVDYDSTSDDD